MRKIVLLPAPDSPNEATTSASLISKFIFKSNAPLDPKRRFLNRAFI